MKTPVMLAGLVLTMGGLVGCGGDDGGDGGGGISTDASSEEFCANFQQLAEDLGQFGADAEPKDAIAALQDGADRIRETGVPENATDEEREGLEVTLDAIDGIDPDASLEDISSLDETLSESEQEKSEAFDDYLDKECGEIE